MVPAPHAEPTSSLSTYPAVWVPLWAKLALIAAVIAVGVAIAVVG